MAAPTLEDFQVVLRDPQRFTDPLARHTEWSPLSASDSTQVEAGFNTPEGDRLKSSSNIFLTLLYFAVTASGALCIVGWLDIDTALGQRIANAFFMDGDITDLIQGVFLFSLGLMVLVPHVRPRVFDRNSGWFHVGYFPPAAGRHWKWGNRAVRLEKIRAVQLLTKRRLDESGKGLQIVHELNLVLEDATRLHVFSHGDLSLLRQDARTISGFLSIPVWDAAQSKG